MVQNFMESKTKDNLMRAFAGESIARNRYIFSASLAKKEHQHVLEYDEHDSIYKDFGETARQEGFDGVASSFLRIAEIEKIHGDRFGRFASLLEEGSLYVSDLEIDWICLKCGHVYHGYEAPRVCPVCGHAQGYFIRMDLCPFQ